MIIVHLPKYLFSGTLALLLSGCRTPSCPAPIRPLNIDFPSSNQCVFTAVEVNNSVIIYNIKEASTTQQVELGAILKAGLVEDSMRTHYLRYDLGEPSLTFINGIGESTTLEGNLVPFSENPALAVTPIQSSVQPIPGKPFYFDPDNTVSNLRYAIQNNLGKEVQTTTRPVGLKRTFVKEGPVTLSLYEFKHVFKTSLSLMIRP